MYTCQVMKTYGTGALRSPSQYWTGYGSAVSKSADKAWSAAHKKAEQACGEGGDWIPVLYVARLYKDGKLIKEIV